MPFQEAMLFIHVKCCSALYYVLYVAVLISFSSTTMELFTTLFAYSIMTGCVALVAAGWDMLVSGLSFFFTSNIKVLSFTGDVETLAIDTARELF